MEGITIHLDTSFVVRLAYGGLVLSDAGRRDIEALLKERVSALENLYGGTFELETWLYSHGTLIAHARKRH